MSRRERLAIRIEDWWYQARRNGWRCAIGIHRHGLWADYSGWDYEPPDPYWHCVVCGEDGYPLRFRISDAWWASRLGAWVARKRWPDE